MHDSPISFQAKPLPDRFLHLVNGNVVSVQILEKDSVTPYARDFQFEVLIHAPPLLDRTVFESGNNVFCLYCLGKDNGENIMRKSLKKGTISNGTVSDVIMEGTEGAVHKVQVYQRHYSLIIHYTDAKKLGKREMILEGEGAVLDERTVVVSCRGNRLRHVDDDVDDSTEEIDLCHSMWITFLKVMNGDAIRL
ncbi:hypothetical protein Tco_1283217 [Tanacetum coccineum]